MALTKVSRGLLSTSIVDNGNATAITIDSSENVTFSGTVTAAALTVDTDTLHVDATNNRVGIGTSSPSNDLHISSTSGTKALFERTGSTGAYIGLKDSSGSVVYLGDNNGTFEVQTAGSSYSTKLAVTSAGNVGIGKIPLGNNLSPALEMAAGGTMFGYGDAMYLTGNLYYNGGWKAIATGAGASMILDASGPKFYTNASASAGGAVTPIERMRIDSSGNVGIGGTSTGYKVHVFGNESMIRMQNTGSGTNGFLDLAVSSTVATINANYSTSAIPLRFLTGAAERMRIASSGQLFLFGQTSGAGNADLRYTTGTGAVTYDTSSRLVKAEIEDIPYGLSTVMALSPKRYERTDSDNKLEVGFIADEVVEVVPELVGMMEKRFLTMNQEDTEVIAGSVEYNKMTAVLVKAIQEQQETIEAQAAAITDLTTRLTALENT